MDPTKLFPKPGNTLSMHYEQPFLLLGSCFSTHLGDRLRNAGFAVNNNPFGVIFHPLPMARFLIETLKGNADKRSLKRDDVWLSWDAGSEVYGMSETALTERLQTLREDFLQHAAAAQVLIVTFGSAHGYRLTTSGKIVANCHKAPSDRFEKELTELPELLEQWTTALQLLQEHFPQLKIILTVSPVRYSRDGWSENNRSKARLFELTEQLQRRFGVDYFPAFELINDVLRDYRYFEVDGVHPNCQAIDHVWELFRSWYFDETTNGLVQEMENLRRMEAHRILFPESVKSAEFKKLFHEKRESFLSLHPSIIW